MKGKWRVESREYLIAPKEFITVLVLEAIPGVKKLCDTVKSDVISVAFCLIPGQRGSEIQ